MYVIDFCKRPRAMVVGGSGGDRGKFAKPKFRRTSINTDKPVSIDNMI